MLECINKECRQYKSGVCPKECDRRIKPTHIPNYAEEQLEYAKENEQRTIEGLRKELGEKITRSLKKIQI